MDIFSKIIKKFLAFLLNVILVVAVVSLFVTTVLGITFYNAHSIVEEGVEYYEDRYVDMGNCYVAKNLLRNGGVWVSETADSRAEINYNEAPSVVADCLSKFPEHIKTYINDNWSIVFTKEIPDFASGYLTGYNTSDYSAVTVPDLQTIFVFSDNGKALSYILSHEFGHAIAYEYGFLDYTSEFIELYNRYKGTYKENTEFSVEGYATSSASEFFASALQAYIYEPEWLWQEAPTVAYYMQNVLSSPSYDNDFEKYCVRAKGLILIME